MNAWSEISAMLAATATSLWLHLGMGPGAFGLGSGTRDSQLFLAYALLVTTAVVTLVWLVVTWLTPPTDTATLVSFYRHTRPGRAGWGPIAALAPEVESDTRLGLTSVDIRFVGAQNKVQLHTGPSLFDLSTTVNPGGAYNFSVTMLAPFSAGNYGEVWELVTGSNQICTFSVYITVP